MRRILSGLVAILVVGVLAACNARLAPATMQLMDDTEALWNGGPISSYTIVVDVDRPDDRRRNTITVQRGQITSAVVSYWDPKRKAWDEPYELNEQQAFPFTVPGLFDMVRGELKNSGRNKIRVEVGEDPPFPRRIVLGPVLLDGRPVSGTEATVTVKTFQAQPP